MNASDTLADPRVRLSENTPVQTTDADNRADRDIRFQYSRNLPAILERLHVSFLVSTYQAGKLVVVGVDQGKLALTFHNFERAMGIAVAPDRIAVGTQNQVWTLRRDGQIGPQIAPAGRYDTSFLTRQSYFTGEIQGHELALLGNELWVVNTLFSCLATVDERYSFTPRWRPPFISALAAEDRCHLNGMACDGGRPKYVTVVAESDERAGWRAVKATGGCLLEVPSGRVAARGLCMPHSPRIHEDRVLVLDSGKGGLVSIAPESGEVTTVASLPGYTRGLAVHGPLAFVGLSRIRETAAFGELPISQDHDNLDCGVALVELASGREVARLTFDDGVEEIFDVQIVPQTRLLAITGPFAHIDGQPTIWAVPADASHANSIS